LMLMKMQSVPWMARMVCVAGRAACLPLLLVAVLCSIPLHSEAALFGDDEAREAILQLREQRTKDQEALTAQIDRLSRSLLEINNQLEAVRADLARMRGQDEVLAKDVSEIQRRYQELRQGVDERVRKLEPKEVVLDGKSFKAEPDEVALYDKALALLKGADFSEALLQFQTLLKQYPNTGYRESTLYWQGNAHYGLRACKPAMEAFRSLLAASPQHLRAPEALLSIANCHTELKEPNQARKTLESLVKTYPDAEAAQVAKERLTHSSVITPAGAPDEAKTAAPKPTAPAAANNAKKRR
jgi:tol-pal system protein YbgF